MSTRNACLVLAGLVLAWYAQTLGFEFLRFDDGDYVVDNPHVRGGLSPENIAWAFGAYHSSNWHPLTWLSHQLDCALFGLRAGMHHLVSGLLHAANAVLLFLFLVRGTGRKGAAWFVAAGFALHPLRAQSVAWVSERKDVLAGLFFLLTLHAWISYARDPSARRYALVLVAHAAALLSKPSAVALPLVLLVVDAWPLERELSLGRRLLEKLPFALLALGSGLITLAAQASGGALESYPLSLGVRTWNAFTSYWIYLLETVLPLGLAYFRPHPAIVAPEASQLVPGLAALSFVVLVSAWAWCRRQASPAFLAGWLWYLVALLPMIGLVQVGEQAHADRYTYLATIGLLVAAAYSVPRHDALRFGAAGLLLFWAALWLREIGTWRDSRTLFARALAVTERNYMAEAGMGNVLRDERRIPEARAHYERALAVRPDFPQVLYNLGLLEQEAGNHDLAIELYQRAVELRPESISAWLNLGAVHGATGRLREAVAAFDEVLVLEPGNAVARENLENLRDALQAEVERPGASAEARELLVLVQRALRR